jgi:type I restriction enzyme S subunit
MALMRVDRAKAHPRFLLYAFLGPEFQELIRARTVHGSTVERIALIEFPGFPISVPSLEEQRAIASVLGALDDKIELNRRMNETLEAIARAIFKSWFVDFEPVRAKMEGRRPFGMDAATAALFPCSFQRALGTPTGWKQAGGGELFELVRDPLNPLDYPEELFDHYSIPAFDSGRRPIREKGAEIKSQKSLMPDDCILVSKLNPRIPRIWLPDVDRSVRSICSAEFLVARPQLAQDRAYLFGMFTCGDFSERFVALVTGTSGSHQRVKPADLLAFPMVVPDEAIRTRYATVATPLLSKIAMNVREAATLESIRETLLPKLISGEIRLKDAEKQAEAAL